MTTHALRQTNSEGKFIQRNRFNTSFKCCWDLQHQQSPGCLKVRLREGTESSPPLSHIFGIDCSQAAVGTPERGAKSSSPSPFLGGCPLCVCVRALYLEIPLQLRLKGGSRGNSRSDIGSNFKRLIITLCPMSARAYCICTVWHIRRCTHKRQESDQDHFMPLGPGYYTLIHHQTHPQAEEARKYCITAHCLLLLQI
jgi:hypothetical protein